MAPLVVTKDPDLTDSEEEKNETKLTEESVKITIEDISSTISADASEPVSSTVSEKSTTEVDCIESQTIIDENSVAQTSAVDALQHIHPWEGEPAKEPEYPPGTYRGMF